jgi:hypothetical protein
MKKTIDANMMKEIFVNYDRDYYTIEGLKTLLNYYNNIDPEMEFDPIAICCDCTEYGNGAACSFDDLIYNYEYLYPVDDYLEEHGYKGSEFCYDHYLDELIEHLEDKTTVLSIPNGNYIVFEF